MLQGARCRSTTHIHTRTALFLVVQQVRSQSYSKKIYLGLESLQSSLTSLYNMIDSSAGYMHMLLKCTQVGMIRFGLAKASCVFNCLHFLLVIIHHLLGDCLTDSQKIYIWDHCVECQNMFLIKNTYSAFLCNDPVSYLDYIWSSLKLFPMNGGQFGALPVR